MILINAGGLKPELFEITPLANVDARASLRTNVVMHDPADHAEDSR